MSECSTGDGIESRAYNLLLDHLYVFKLSRLLELPLDLCDVTFELFNVLEPFLLGLFEILKLGLNLFCTPFLQDTLTGNAMGVENTTD